MQPMDYNGLAE